MGGWWAAENLIEMGAGLLEWCPKSEDEDVLLEAGGLHVSHYVGMCFFVNPDCLLTPCWLGLFRMTTTRNLC